MATTLPRAARVLFFRLCTKGWLYWFNALVVLVLSILATPYVDYYLGLTEARYSLFQKLIELSPRPLKPKFVKVVLIKDDEYWKGYPAGRRPIKRDYLARWVDALDEANAQVIALDFDVRLPDPESKEIPREYKQETEKLIGSILHAAKTRRVVLGKTIWFERGGGFKLNNDIYTPYGICTGVDQNGQWENPGTPEFPITEQAKKNITCGHINLSDDMRLIPGRAPIENGRYVQPFALAVAKAKNHNIVADLADNINYSSYISQETLDKYHVIFSAGDLLNGKQDIHELNSEAVIVGADWSTFAYGQGPPVDLHVTPVREMVGVIIHENFAEALLDSRQYSETPGWLVHAFEILFSLLAAAVFALSSRFWRKLAAVILFSALLILVQWAAVQVLGVFFEAFVPLLGLWLHSIGESFLA